MANENLLRAEKNTTQVGVLVAKSLPISDEQIRQRAYEIFLARAGKPGDASSDWLQAERELRQMALNPKEWRTGTRSGGDGERTGGDPAQAIAGTRPAGRKRKKM